MKEAYFKYILAKKSWSVGVLFPTLVFDYASRLNKLSVFTCEFKIISE